MENSGQNIIEQLRKKVEDDAQRKSEKIRAEANQILDTNKNVELKSTNIFANLKKPEQINLFGNERKSVNLFQIKPKTDVALESGANQNGKNIFNVQQKPAIANVDSEDEGQGEAEGQATQKSQLLFKSEPQVKVMKYEYQNELNKLHETVLRKFKNGTSLARQQIYVSLQYLNKQPITLYMVVRSSATKVIVYQAIMMKNMTKMEHFMGKLDNLKFEVLKKNTIINDQDDNGNKLKKELVKLQFQTAESCEQFKKVVANYFDSKQ